MLNAHQLAQRIVENPPLPEKAFTRSRYEFNYAMRAIQQLGMSHYALSFTRSSI